MTNNQKTILIVSPYFPYPVIFGGIADLFRKIQILKKYGYNISLISTIKKMPSESEIKFIRKYVIDTIFIKRKRFNALFSLYPFQVSSRSKLQEYKLYENYDYLIIEGDYVANILKNKTLSVTKTILRMHNNESKYAFELFKSSFPSFVSLYYLIESFKFKVYSKYIYKKVDHIACVSKDECKLLNSHSYKNAVFSPVSIDISTLKQRHLNTKTIIYVGALFLPNNVEGLAWYIKNIHAHLKLYPDYKFIIIGSTHSCKDEAKILKMCRNNSQIDIIFNATNLEKYYSQSSIFINPTLKGAGVKIKSINAVIEGLPLVTTEVGVEGIGLKNKEHVLVSKNSEDFRNHIELLFNDPLLGESLIKNAQKFLSENYTESKILNSLLGHCR
jgi:glycosyltransferase involved in cell wall biosynthesis